MDKAKLLLQLYSDYSDASVGNDMSKAEDLATAIHEDIYPHLMDAGTSEYAEEVYFAAVKFFQARHMQELIVNLQIKMFNITMEKEKNSKSDVDCTECVNRMRPCISKALRERFFHLAIELGKKGLNLAPKTQHLAFVVGKSLYMIGNYSDSQIWLARSLELVNEALTKDYSLTLRETRCITCFYLIMIGDFTNVLCYGYIIKDTMSILAETIKNEFQEKSILGKQTQPEIPSTETALTVETKSFIWYQLTDRLNIIKQKCKDAGMQFSSVIQMYRHYLIIFELIICPFISFRIAKRLVCAIADCMHKYCSDKQKACCMSCFYICICISVVNVLFTWLFVIFLDVLY